MLKLKIKSRKGKIVRKDTYRIFIQGAVQGVGFRPFIYRLAKRMNLTGWVENTSQGVVIEVEAENRDRVYEFISRIYEQKPKTAHIEYLNVQPVEYKGYEDFVIKESSESSEKKVLVLPDLTVCSQCLQELFNPKDRRYLYPFINCTQCGPRFTIIKDIPYDRYNTTMAEFQMCPKCEKEYHNPESRRFHAQPNACWDCGPQLQLLDNRGEIKSRGKDAIPEVIKLLKEGKIVALKSLGGYQIAVDALNDNAVVELRKRKRRIHKPFALMARDLKMISEYAIFNEYEKALLLSTQRPIVLLRKTESCKIAHSVAEENKYLGFMLPYTPMHYLIFKELDSPLVMTSGNITEEPIYYKDQEAFEKLEDVVDYFLTHNREIHIRCDDSVTRVFVSLDGRFHKEYLIRRARGYVPRPLTLNYHFKHPILAVGAQLKNTFALAKDNHVFISQHIGDLDNYSAVKAFEESIPHFEKIFDIRPQVIACDIHPEYYTSKFARKMVEVENKKLIQVQHHHAHIASCMAENNLDEKVIGIALDGTGYGNDETIWGGEVLIADLKEFQRVAHLQYLPQPGGESAVKNPWQMAVSWLYHAIGDEIFNIEFTERIGKERVENIIAMIKNNINSPLTSSMGRLFASVSSIVGLCDTASFHGEAEMRLEQIQDEYCREHYQFQIQEQDKQFIIIGNEVIKQIIQDLKNSVPIPRISAKFHNGVMEILYQICIRLRRRFKLNKVCLSGGVFQNIFLVTKLYQRLRDKKFEVYIQGKVPANDGGICLGQIVIANARLE
jgi:hydrogenase maturation protein HypF